MDIGATPIVGVRRRPRINTRDHSTVVEIEDGIPKILREGAVSKQTILPLINRVSRAEYGDTI